MPVSTTKTTKWFGTSSTMHGMAALILAPIFHFFGYAWTDEMGVDAERALEILVQIVSLVIEVGGIVMVFLGRKAAAKSGIQLTLLPKG